MKNSLLLALSPAGKLILDRLKHDFEFVRKVPSGFHLSFSLGCFLGFMFYRNRWCSQGYGIEGHLHALG